MKTRILLLVTGLSLFTVITSLHAQGTVFTYQGRLPVILGLSLSGTNLVLNGSNGLSGGTYYTWMSTNVAKPLNQWSPIATNVLGAGGNFTITITNTVNPTVPQRFYILQLQ
jgi:hypothetical protein